MTTPTDEDLLALADRLEAPAYWLSGSDEGHEGENAAPREAAAALRAIAAERQAIRDKALDDAAQAASNRAAYFRDAAETASEAGFHALRAFHAMRELCLVEIAAAIRAMKGKPE